MTEFGSTSSSIITGIDTVSGTVSTDAYKVSTMIKSINESIITMNGIQSDASDHISDGYHTFKELYKHRTYLFAAVCNMFNNMAWKSLKHSDGTMYDGMFIAGMSSPYGDMTYHVELEYWDLFQVKTLANAPQFDGHTPDDVLERIMLVVNTRDLLNKLRETKTNDILEEKKVILKYKCDLTSLFERCFSLSDGVCYLRISPDIEVTVISNSADNSNRIIAAKIPLMYELIQCATIYMNTLTGKFVEVVLTEPYKSAPGAFTFTESTMNGYYPSVLEKFNTYAIKSPTTSDLKKDEATSDTSSKTETVPGEPTYFDFSSALRLLVSTTGIHLARKAVPDRILAYQPAYPNGINCNAQTAATWGITEGDLFKCMPYLQSMDTLTNTAYMWTPTTEDLLAKDWYIVVMGDTNV